MKSNEIVIFSVSKTITQRIHNVLIEKEIEIPVYEFRYSDVLEQANLLIQSGTKIIISRGGTAALLRSNLTIPVIEIAHDFHGVYRILQKAKNKSQKIAAVGFPQFCNALRHYQNMTHDEFKICQVYNHYDIENVVKNLSESDYQVVIGGLTVAEMAEKYALNVVMGDTDNISIEQAINEAFSMLSYIKQENAKLLMSQSALNQSREGIICINSIGEIININAVGLTFFQCHVGDKILKNPVFKDLYPSIINELDIKDHPIDINGVTILVAIKHYINKTASYSIITGTYPGNSQWTGTARINSKHHGFIAKYSFENIIGQSSAMMKAIEMAKLYALHDMPINIVGETGTGKELFAQSIHNVSAQHQSPFIAINCAAIPENLLESELFGYNDGAFTNARKGGKPGVFEMAANGTVFLDEISEAPLSVQIKLLRVLQEKQFTRLGGDALINAKFRLITASNIALEEHVARGAFRQDLYYRICTLKLSLPALREREEDIQLLIHHYFQQQNKHLEFTSEALDLLNNYMWPGNLRELQAVIYRLTVLAKTKIIDKQTLLQLGQLSPQRSMQSTMIEHSPLAEETDLLKKQERRLITHVIEKTNGDRMKASAMLGISPTTLWRKLKEHRLQE